MEQAKSGLDPIGSLGFDGPLAALSKNRVNMADYFKETVAVVTNPAIDRSRECEAFSTRSLVGTRPEIGSVSDESGKFIMLESPLLSGGHPAVGEIDFSLGAVNQTGFFSIEELVSYFEGGLAWLPMSIQKGQSVQETLARITQTAVEAVRSGTICLVLDDTEAILSKQSWLDPLLATAAVDNALRFADDANNLRRKAGIVVRSASIRNLHDIILLCSFGANAVNPYAILAIPQIINKENNENEPGNKEYQSNILKPCGLGLRRSFQQLAAMNCADMDELAVQLAFPQKSPVFFKPLIILAAANLG